MPGPDRKGFSPTLSRLPVPPDPNEPSLNDSKAGDPSAGGSSRGGCRCECGSGLHSPAGPAASSLCARALCLSVQSKEKPMPGDLIQIDRGVCKHWAIDVGDGLVIHATPSGKD